MAAFETWCAVAHDVSSLPCINQAVHTGLIESMYALTEGNPMLFPEHLWSHDAFMTLPRHTSTREDEVQPVVE
jgi:hypothetical protein